MEVKGKLTCSTTNLVYCITCRKGGPSFPTHPQYIGEMGKSLVERFRGHKGTVVQKGQEGHSTSGYPLSTARAFYS